MADAAISCATVFVVGGGVPDAPIAFSLRRRCQPARLTDEVLRIQHPFTIPAVDDIGLDLHFRPSAWRRPKIIVATSVCTGVSNSPVAVPKISCSLFAHEILTAATRSPPSSRHWRRSCRSP